VKNDQEMPKKMRNVAVYEGLIHAKNETYEYKLMKKEVSF
jgi:hypothetical protein